MDQQINRRSDDTMEMERNQHPWRREIKNAPTIHG
jgi:hypothetical protein